jgi:hypothetical protein
MLMGVDISLGLNDQNARPYQCVVCRMNVLLAYRGGHSANWCCHCRLEI